MQHYQYPTISSIGAELKINQPQDFACHMSYVILTDIIQTVLETECFLSNTNTNMHILATMTEEQAVYSGHLFIQATQYCPCHKKLTSTCRYGMFATKLTTSKCWKPSMVDWWNQPDCHSIYRMVNTAIRLVPQGYIYGAAVAKTGFGPRLWALYETLWFVCFMPCDIGGFLFLTCGRNSLCFHWTDLFEPASVLWQYM